MSGPSFVSKILDSLFSANDPEAQKKRMLKAIAKDLSKSKFHFYKPSSHEALPALAKYFYDIYKVISPAQIMFQAMSENALKNATVDALLSERQRAAQESLSEAAITERSRDVPIKELAAQVKEQLKVFTKEFDNGRRDQIDGVYNKLNLLRTFCSYDFYFMLKKFDSSLRERNFDLAPRFNAINGTYVVEDLRNFISVAWTVPFDADWSDLFAVLKAIKGVEPITLANWKKVLARLKALRDQQVLEMMIKLISENPGYNEKPRYEETRVVDSFVSEVKKTAEETVRSIQEQQVHSKVDGLLAQIFGETPVMPLRYYNQQASAQFERKSIGSYKYSEPLSYLKQFLLDYGKKDIRAVSDILLVRGSWANPAQSKPMSEAWHQLLGISDQITAFDAKLSESAELGMKFRTLMPRADRDKEARSIIHTTLRDINAAAAGYIRSTSQNLIVYARTLKTCIEDFGKQPHSDIIINWKEIDHFAEDRLRDMCVDVYKKIYLIVTLLQNFPIEKEESPAQ